MQQVNITELRQHLPSWITKVSEGECVQVTVHGKVVARITPEVDAAEAAWAKLVALRATAEVGDLLSPIDEPWGTDSDHL